MRKANQKVNRDIAKLKNKHKICYYERQKITLEDWRKKLCGKTLIIHL